MRKKTEKKLNKSYSFPIDSSICLFTHEAFFESLRCARLCKLSGVKKTGNVSASWHFQPVERDGQAVHY